MIPILTDNARQYTFILLSPSKCITYFTEPSFLKSENPLCNFWQFICLPSRKTGIDVTIWHRHSRLKIKVTLLMKLCTRAPLDFLKNLFKKAEFKSLLEANSNFWFLLNNCTFFRISAHSDRIWQLTTKRKLSFQYFSLQIWFLKQQKMQYMHIYHTLLSCFIKTSRYF